MEEKQRPLIKPKRSIVGKTWDLHQFLHRHVPYPQFHLSSPTEISKLYVTIVGRTRLFSSSRLNKSIARSTFFNSVSVSECVVKEDGPVSSCSSHRFKLTPQHIFLSLQYDRIKVVKSPRPDIHPLLSFVPSHRSLDPHNLSRTVLESMCVRYSFGTVHVPNQVKDLCRHLHVTSLATNGGC